MTVCCCAAESIGDHTKRMVDSRIRGRGIENLPLWSGWDASSGMPNPNPKSWVADLDLSCVSVAVLRDGEWRREGCATLVTEEVVTMATHNSYGPGTMIRFLDRRLQVVDRVITATFEISGSDLTIGRLDRRIERADIRPAELLGLRDSRLRLANVLPLAPRDRGPIPVLCLNRDRAATLQVLGRLDRRVLLLPPATVGDKAKAYEPFFIQPISGTSGCPLFLIIEDRAVILGHYSTAKPETGPFYGFYQTQLDSAIAHLGGADRVGLADLGRFPAATFPGVYD
ncbi:MAG: hypothetical protein SFV32_09900 [Opitutaceae bacterium]|nr:hypothetical protein [Opitutaceae bacterium]